MLHLFENEDLIMPNIIRFLKMSSAELKINLHSLKEIRMSLSTGGLGIDEKFFDYKRRHYQHIVNAFLLTGMIKIAQGENPYDQLENAYICIQQFYRDDDGTLTYEDEFKKLTEE